MDSNLSRSRPYEREGASVEITTVYYLALPLSALCVVLAGILLRRSWRKVHKMTRPGLEERTIAASESLAAFCNERETNTVSDLVAVGGHEIHDSDESEEDPEAQILYQEHYLPEVTDLREQFARRRLREKALDRVYEDSKSLAEIRTVSTGLLVMADKLR